MKRATKKETETRVAHAAELVLEGQAYSAVTSLVAEKYDISRPKKTSKIGILYTIAVFFKFHVRRNMLQLLFFPSRPKCHNSYIES